MGRRAIRSECVEIKIPWLVNVPGEVIEVDARAQKRYKSAVYTLSGHMMREFGYNRQFDIDERGEDFCAYLFMHPETYTHSDFAYPAVGACCFRFREYEENPRWALQWVWIHPFFRRRGILSMRWPWFRMYFGDFDVEEPLSDAMQGFLKKIGEVNG